MAEILQRATQGPGNSPKVLRELIVPALALVLGGFILLPTAIGQIARPFVWSAVLPWFLGISSIAVVSLLLAFMTDSWIDKRWRFWSHVTHGIGNILSLVSLLLIGLFLLANYREDLYARPRVQNIKINPVSPETNKVVEVELEVFTQNNKPIRYVWEFDGKAVPGMRSAYIKMPENPGRYLLAVTLHDGLDSGTLEMPSESPDAFPTATGVKIWLDVAVATAPSMPTSAPAAAQSIFQICNGDTNAKSTRTTCGGKRTTRPLRAVCPK